MFTQRRCCHYKAYRYLNSAGYLCREKLKVEVDKAGYFVIIPQRPDKIYVEHYSNDNKLLGVVEGKDAQSLYSKIVEEGWVTQLSHAAYLGKELARAELSLKMGFRYVQDQAQHHEIPKQVNKNREG